jgi:hypothetical protein
MKGARFIGGPRNGQRVGCGRLGPESRYYGKLGDGNFYYFPDTWIRDEDGSYRQMTEREWQEHETRKAAQKRADELWKSDRRLFHGDFP